MPWAALNSAEFRGADFPSIGGHGSALGLARFYSALASGGRLDGRSLLESRLVREALTEQAHEKDMFMGAPVRMGLALMLSNEQFPLTGRPTSFGQPGLGGVAGVGDTDGGIGIGVIVNRMSAGFQNPLLEGLLAGIARRSAQ
jgi:CubicO group peptidase (beta-lactamase class C family)